MPKMVPKERLDLSIPKLRQGRLMCGPAALKMVFMYFRCRVSMDRIIQLVGGIKGYGVRTIKLAEAARKTGFSVKCYSSNYRLARRRAEIKKPKMRDILYMLQRNIPVIIAVRSWMIYKSKPSAMGHFIVVTGYKNGIFKYNDPADGKRHSIRKVSLHDAWLANAVDSSAYFLAIWPEDWVAKKRR